MICFDCSAAITLQEEKALSGESALVWSSTEGWVCPTTGNEHRISVSYEAEIENHYEDGDMVTTHVTFTAPALPEQESDEETEWVDEHVYDLTGTGHETGDSAYFVKITASTHPAYVGREFEIGT